MNSEPTRTPWLHASDGGPVRFTIRGGFCQECQAGPLHPYADDPAEQYVYAADMTRTGTGP